MSRQLAGCAIPPLLKTKLLQCGFTTSADIAGLRPSDLSREVNITHKEANQIFESVRKPRASGTSALQLLQQPQESIQTFSQQIDELLGGKGVMVGQVTEFCGVPGIGKTQLGMQIACNASIPTSLGGVGGEALYMDTEGSFLAERCAEIAGAMVEELYTLAGGGGMDVTKLQMSFTEETILKGIHYFRIYDDAGQLATLRSLDRFLHLHPMVKVLVVDSIAFHFRRGYEDFSLRARVLMGMAQLLIQLANTYHIAVVVMNQVTTKFVEKTNGTSTIAPALGQSWAHACTNRVMLSWYADGRQATLLKSPSCKTATVKYAVNAAGVRDEDPEEKTG